MQRSRPDIVRRALLLAGAAAALGAAAGVILAAGLPDRAAFTGGYSADQIPTAPEINAAAPPFILYDLDEQPVRLSDLRGSPLIINFWATWCGPCRVEMPILERIYNTHQTGGLRILAINLGETPAEIRAWRDELGLTYNLLVDAPMQAAALYHLRGQPSTYIVSPNGIISAVFYGPASETALLAALAPYLAG